MENGFWVIIGPMRFLFDMAAASNSALEAQHRRYLELVGTNGRRDEVDIGRAVCRLLKAVGNTHLKQASTLKLLKENFE